MASIMDKLKALGLGQKGTVQYFHENDPYGRYIAPGGGAVRGEPMTPEILEARRRYHSRPENVVTMSEPEIGYDFGPMDASGMGGYSQGGLFDYVQPTTPQPTYSQPKLSAPEGNIPRRERAANAIQPKPEPVSIADEAINNLMARLSSYYSEPEMPRKSDMLGERPPVAVPGYAGGMFSPRIDPNVPSPDINLSMQNYPEPDMFNGRLPQPPIPKAVRGGFTGELPMPSPVSLNMAAFDVGQAPNLSEEELDAIFKQYQENLDSNTY